MKRPLPPVTTNAIKTVSWIKCIHLDFLIREFAHKDLGPIYLQVEADRIWKDSQGYIGIEILQL